MSGSFTVFGANGFIGSSVIELIERRGETVHKVRRGDWPHRGSNLGHVIFTIGMTADFRLRLIETFDLQILRLHEALTQYTYDSFTYLSSGRLYAGAASTHEDAALLVRPAETDHVYNISKLAGESLCLAFPNPNIRVVRLSNVYGENDVSNLFLTAVMREAVNTGSVVIGQSPLSSKDYVNVEFAAEAILAITGSGQHRLYNVAHGRNIAHQEIANILRASAYNVDFREGGALAEFPAIDTSRFDNEFGIVRAEPGEAILRVLKALERKKTKT